ncbi:MAG: hypothetical protein Pg6C_10250 [Treponemataceae bacterium]|jgi:hypothetical protein|nr:MAG: hypothetical protein Pg6C_10250 [Treponemataceae bacterium]
MKKNDESDNQGTAIVDTAQTLCVIEEHAASLKVSADVFAAVKQFKGWQAGKKVERREFEKAVKEFLGSPAGGV